MKLPLQVALACFAAALLIFICSLVHGAETEHIYVPTAALYIDGDFVNVVQTGKPEESMHECMDKLNRVIIGALESDDVPHGGSVLGACEALPKHFEQR